MRRGYRPILLAFITFLVNGLTYGQNNEPNCGTFCLATEATCTCTLSEGSLTWEVRNANGDVIGQRTVDESDEDTPTTLFGDDFEAASVFGITVISSTSGTFTSEMSFDTVSEYQGYEIECSVGNISSVRTINIAEPPSVANLNLATFTTDSALLTFERSVSGDCVVNYTVTSNASVPSSPISDTSVTISRPPNSAEEATYFVCVSAVDFAEETGPPSCLDCFRFTSPNAVIFYSDVSYTYMISNDVCGAIIEWTVEDCLPKATIYQITASSADVAVIVNKTVNAATFALQNVSSGEVYSVTIIPSNTFGFGAATFTNFTVPPTCKPSPTTESIPSSVPTTSAPATSAILAIVVGSIAAVATCFIVTLLAVTYFVVKMKRKKATSSLLSETDVALNVYETNRDETVKTDEGCDKRFYADISHDKSKSAKPPPKSDEKVTYSDISQPHQPQYVDLDVARGGRKIPQKQEAVVYSQVKNVVTEQKEVEQC